MALSSCSARGGIAEADFVQIIGDIDKEIAQQDYRHTAYNIGYIGRDSTASLVTFPEENRFF
jgi:hypothetical protein